MKRALASLSAWQKVKLGFNILTSTDSITKEEVEKCKNKDLLEGMLEDLAGEYPSMTRVFLDERDVYLAHNLFAAAESAPVMMHGGGRHRYPPPPPPPTQKQQEKGDEKEEEEAVRRVVVGVVGMGHVKGIQVRKTV